MLASQPNSAPSPVCRKLPFWRRRNLIATRSAPKRLLGILIAPSPFGPLIYALCLKRISTTSFGWRETSEIQCFASTGVYTPVLAKHSKHFSLEDSLAIGVDRMQRNFGPLKQQVEEWGIVGLILGRIVLWDFTKLASKHQPSVAFGIHLKRMSVVAIVLGALLGLSPLYSELPPEAGVILRSTAWRTMVNSVVALVATVVAMRLIPRIMQLLQRT